MKTGRPPKHFIEAEKAIIGRHRGRPSTPRNPATPGEHIANAFAWCFGYGIDKSSRCGYPIGASYPPDWGERTMSLRLATPLRSSRATFHFMPGLWQDDWGLEITGIPITPTGVEPSVNTPRKLFVKP